MKPSGGSDQSTPNSAVRDQSVSFDAINAGPMVASLDADLSSTAAIITAEERAARQQQLIHDAAKSKRRMVKYMVMGVLLLTAIGVAALRHGSGNQALNNQADASQRFPVTSIPLTTLSTKGSTLSVGNAKTLSINGQLNVNNSIVIAPSTQPNGAVTGQLYYNQANNQLAYYDGKSFQSILAGNDVVTTTLGGASGTLSTGNGLSVTGKTLSNTGVLTVGGAGGNIAAGKGVSVKGGTLNNTGVLTLQGESGNVTLAAGNGIVVNGTTLSNSGLLSLGGHNGNIAVGDGLAIDNGSLHNTGIISATGAGLITVTNDGNGNITIDGPSGGGSGSGTVASPGGTIDKLAKFTGVQTIADSIISDNGTTVTIGGNLSVTGAVTLSSPLTVANGGTGATTAASARTNLGVAASGANNDITSLSGLTTALSVTQGGTGIGVLPTNGVLIGNGASAISGITTATSGLCLVSTAGAPTFQTCPGSGGVASVNSLTGALTLAGVSAGSVSSVGSTITINDASAATKGLASFNATNLTVTSGNVNTVQGISTTATPTFGQLTLTSSQATGTMLDVNNTNIGASGNLLNLALNGTSKLSVNPAGNLTLSGAVNGQTIGSSSSFTGGVTVGGTLSVNTISPTGALTVGVGTQAFTLQGSSSSTLKATSGLNTTTVDFQAPTANVTYNFATAVAGSYDICTTVGNCAGVGGGVTTPGGTTNTLAKFTGSGTIGNSIITDNGSTVTIGGTLSVNTLTPTGALTVGTSSQNLTLQGAAVTLKDTSAGITNSLVFATPATSNKTITLPNASGTIAVSASGPLSLDANGNLTCPTCLTGGGGGGAGVSSLNSQTGDIILQGASAGSVSTVGTTITINDATSAVKGLASFNATNLTVTAGNVNTVQNIATTSTPTFAGLNLSSALTVANGGTGATTAAGARTNLGAAASGANNDITSLSGLTTALSVLQGGTGATSLTANGVLVGNGTSAVTSVTGTNGQCLMVVAGTPAFGTCPGGGGVTTLDGLSGTLTINNSSGSGSAITINNAAADGLTKGIATFNSSNFSAVGGVVNTIQNIGTGASPTFNGLTLSTALTVANGGTGLGVLTANQLLFANSTSTISQLANGSAGLCLMSNGAAVAPSFQTCAGAGGVSSIDGLTGSVTLANSSGSAGTITISNAAADGSTKGIAAFNSTNFTAASGVINTVQGIATTSTPTFAGLNLSSALTVGNGGTGSTTAAGARSNLGAAASGANSDITSLSGLTTALSVSQGGTGLTALSAFGILYASSTSAISQLSVGTSGQCLISNGAGLAPSFQACPGGGSLSGSGTSGKIALFNGSSSLTSSDITDSAGSLSVASGVSLTLQGAALFENSADSSTAFRVQDHLANNLLAIDTSGDNVNIGATGTTALSTTISIGTSSSSSKNQTVIIGATTSGSSTSIQGGSSGVSISASTGNSISIGTTNSNNITIGKFSGTNPIILQGNGITQTIQGLTTNPASDIIKTSSNSVTAFQVQNSSGYSIFNVDTSGNTATLGNRTLTAGQGVAGSLAFADGTTDNRILTLSTTSLSNNWTLSLPAIGASSGQCLQSTSGSTTTATVLAFASCGGAGSTTLQQAYNASAGANPDIDMTSTNKGFTIQNDNASPISGELFGIHDKTSSGLGSTLLSVADNGDITANSSETTGTGGAFALNANSVSSGNGLNVSANGLTTGNGVNIATTSALQTAGSLFNVSDTATLTTNGGTISGSLVNVNRSVTSNISGGSVATPTLDTASSFQLNSGGGTTGSMTVGANSNRFLFVTIVGQGNVSSGTAYGYPAGVSFGGTSLTEIGSPVNIKGPGIQTETVTYWMLIAPATGAHTFTVTGYPFHDDQGQAFALAADSWYNVHQVTPYGTLTTSTGSGTTASVTATSVSGRVVVDGMGIDNSGLTITKGASQTQATKVSSGTSGLSVGSSYQTASGSTTSMSWTSSFTGLWGEGAIDLIGAPSSSETISSSVANFSNNCTENTGSVCNDATNVLSVNQQYLGATGAALGIQNSGQGFGLQIQNGSSASALTVTTTNLVGIDSTTSSSAAVLTLGKVGSGGSIAAEGSVSSSLGDYAEYFPQATPGLLQPGDVVCVDASGRATHCSASSSPSSITGVVSTSPGFVGNNQIYDASHPDNFALVSMLGQVPVHVSNANGTIHVGDMLTFDPSTGLAVKATSASMTVGEALQDLSSSTGTIQLYIHISYYDPMGLQSDGVSNGYVLQGANAILSTLTVDGTATINTLNVTGSATINSLTVTTSLSTAGITINGHIVTAGSTPTVMAGSAAGTGTNVTIIGNDESGKIMITVGSSVTAGELAQLTFTQAYTAAPNVVLTAGDSGAAQLQQYITPSTTGFSVNAATMNGLFAGQTYTFYYHVMQ